MARCFVHVEGVILAMLPDNLLIPLQQGAGFPRDSEVASLVQVDTTFRTQSLGWLRMPPPAEEDSHQQREHFGAWR